MDPKIVSRLDLQPARTPADLERKYNFAKMAGQVEELVSPQYRVDLVRQTAQALGTSLGDRQAMSLVELPAGRWQALGENLYGQEITPEGVSSQSKVDLHLTPEQILRLSAFALTARNEGGSVTVLALGSKPQEDLQLQVCVTTAGEQTAILPMELSQTRWESLEGNIYAQAVTLEGVGSHSRIDLDLSPEQIFALSSQGIALTAQNEGGAVTVFALGAKPSEDLTLQATMKEVRL